MYTEGTSFQVIRFFQSLIPRAMEIKLKRTAFLLLTSNGRSEFLLAPGDSSSFITNKIQASWVRVDVELLIKSVPDIYKARALSNNNKRRNHIFTGERRLMGKIQHIKNLFRFMLQKCVQTFGTLLARKAFLTKHPQNKGRESAQSECQTAPFNLKCKTR